MQSNLTGLAWSQLDYVRQATTKNIKHGRLREIQLG